MSLTQADAITIGRPGAVDRGLVASTFRYFKRNDLNGLEVELRERWSMDELVTLLDGDDDTAKVAAACLGVVGPWSVCPALARALHHDDALVASMAEHALWMIWLRHPDPGLTGELQDAVRLIDRDREREAIARLDQLIARAPDFAEAYNQRGIAYCLIDRPRESVSDCRRAADLNPDHFAAQAGMGHGFVQLHGYHEALQAYRKALAIHPRMEGVRQSIRQLRCILARIDRTPA